MATNELALLLGKGAIHAGLPLINDLTGLMPRKLNSPLGYPEALDGLGIGDQ